MAKTPKKGADGDKKKPGRPPGRTPTVVVFARVSTALGDALNNYLEATRPTPSTTAVVEVALEEFLRSRGFWPPAEGKDDKD